MKVKKLLSILLVFTMLLPLVACTVQDNSKNNSGDNNEETVTVTDMIGRKVTVSPGKYKKVVCIGAGALRMYTYVGDVAL